MLRRSSKSDDTTPAVEPEKVLTPEEKKAADLNKLAELQVEYDTLKTECESAAKRGESGGASKARKGDVAREIDVLKRKYDLP